MQQDARGLELSTGSAAAARLYDEAVADFVDYRMAASGKLKAALAQDPDFAMATLLRAGFLLMLETTALVPRVERTAAALDALGDRMTRREHLHVQGLAAWAKGDLLRACARYDEILCSHPHDLVALKLHHYLAFWTGRAHALRATVESVLDAWDKSIPGYGSVLGMHAFALEETGEYERAERQGRRGVEIDGDDLWAIHAVAHVLEMQGRIDEGIAWIDRPGDAWADRNPFQGHLWWHACLFLIEKRDFDRVLAIYDEQLEAKATDMFTDVQNMASLLERLELLGVEVADRWRLLADHAEGRVDDHLLAFNDVHLALSLAAGGRGDALARQRASLVAFAADTTSYGASTMSALTLPIVDALAAYAAGDHSRVCDALWPIRNDLWPIGGSHAQRDLFAQILIDSALRDGRYELARGLLGERIVRRPGSRVAWLHYERSLAELGEKAAASRARQAAELIS